MHSARKQQDWLHWLTTLLLYYQLTTICARCRRLLCSAVPCTLIPHFRLHFHFHFCVYFRIRVHIYTNLHIHSTMPLYGITSPARRDDTLVPTDRDWLTD
jgi:hypothetical protein